MTMTTAEESNYLQAIINPLVPGAVEIEKTIDERGVLLTVKLNKEDIGRVIGKKGETARAIRRLIRQFGMANNQHISVKIYEPEGTKETRNRDSISESDLKL